MVSGRFLTIEEEQAGQRIDNYLFRRFKNLPRNHLYRLLRKGEIRVNRRRTRPLYKLVAGDEIRLPPKLTDPERALPPIPASAVARIGGSVIFESERFLVLDKPAGIAVHGGSGLSFGVIELLRRERPQERFLELVHRLDRETSGCLLVAKKRSALRELHQLWRSGAVQKKYTAVLAGRWHGGRVELPLRRIERSGERVVVVDKQGKHALSRFDAVRMGSAMTLAQVDIVTGRTHQIRVHAAVSGHPVVGDRKYGDKRVNGDVSAAGFSRLFLHASSLTFALPGDDHPFSVDAPVPSEFEELINAVA